jgi:hypothetical protein
LSDFLGHEASLVKTVNLVHVRKREQPRAKDLRAVVKVPALLKAQERFLGLAFQAQNQFNRHVLKPFPRSLFKMKTNNRYLFDIYLVSRVL